MTKSIDLTNMRALLSALIIGIALFCANSIQAQTKALVVKGKLHSVEDSQVLIETKVSKDTVKSLSMAGFSVITSEKDIASRTILKNRLFMAYGVDSAGPKLSELKKKIGKRVTFTMQRQKNLRVVITGLK